MVLASRMNAQKLPGCEKVDHDSAQNISGLLQNQNWVKVGKVLNKEPERDREISQICTAGSGSISQGNVSRTEAW